MCDKCDLREKPEAVIRHPQVQVEQPRYKGPIYETVTLDAGIATLVQRLWDLGFATQASCEGWAEGSEGAKRYGTEGYILFRTYELASSFFLSTYQFAEERNESSPNLKIETAIGLFDDLQLDPNPKAIRGTIRFEHADLEALEALWTL